MKAKVTKAEGWDVFLEGRVVHFPIGAVLEDELALLAISDGAASGIAVTAKKDKKAPATKAMAVPENKATRSKEAD